MTNRTRIKYVILFLIFLPYILNIIWSITGLGWLYWGTRFLGGAEEFLGGLLLVLFPMALQKRLFWPGTNPNRIIAALLMSFGIYLLVIGYDDVSLISRRWLEECVNVTACLKYYR